MARAIMAMVVGMLAGAAAAQGPLVQRVKPHDWVVAGDITIRARTDINPVDKMPIREQFDFTSAAVVFPMIKDSASSVAKGLAPQYTVGETGGQLKVNGVVIDDKPTLLAGDYPAGTRLARWQLRDWKGEEVRLQVSIAATCWQTEFNEAEAVKVTVWPETWPSEAQSTFKPQFFVDIMPGADEAANQADAADLQKLLDRWTNRKDPKMLPPVTLAKFLAGEVLRYVQINGNGLNTARTGEIEGFDLQGAAQTARRGRGSEFDAVCLLAAVYRRAGLPCRTVVGYDVGTANQENFLVKGGRGGKGLRGWVEFALPDAAAPGGLAWVPVDIVRMRKSSSRPGQLDKPWPYFGSHDELDGVIPLAFQFHPPTTVVAHGSPGLWGWMVTPKPPEHVIQAIRFSAMTQSVTAESQEKKRREEDAEKRKRRR